MAKTRSLKELYPKLVFIPELRSTHLTTAQASAFTKFSKVQILLACKKGLLRSFAIESTESRVKVNHYFTREDLKAWVESRKPVMEVAASNTDFKPSPVLSDMRTNLSALNAKIDSMQLQLNGIVTLLADIQKVWS